LDFAVYLGIDFLITPEIKLFVSEVNVGLPGGAHEYNLTHLVHHGEPSDIFESIERVSKQVYGKPFRGYLHSLPFIQSLKALKLWMDGMGPFPSTFHPGLRLEDKWTQYQVLHSMVPMPKTMVLDSEHLDAALGFLRDQKRLALKRRVARGGRGFQVISEPKDLEQPELKPHSYLLQEYIQSKTAGYSLSIRSVAFGGQFMCMYANLANRPNSNHGFLTFVAPGTLYALKGKDFGTQSFNQRSWEAEIWFGDNEPSYLRHNLYEEEVAKTTLNLPTAVFEAIKEISVRIERHYERLDLSQLPQACFEKRAPASE
jgi:hypothetical protein